MSNSNNTIGEILRFNEKRAETRPRAMLVRDSVLFGSTLNNINNNAWAQEYNVVKNQRKATRAVDGIFGASIPNANNTVPNKKSEIAGENWATKQKYSPITQTGSNSTKQLEGSAPLPSSDNPGNATEKDVNIRRILEKIEGIHNA